MSVPSERIRQLGTAPVRAAGRYLLYWMIAARRTSWSFALDRSLELARALGKPLVVLEALRCDHPWASDRLHRFILDGMADNAAALARAGVTHLAYVEPERGAGKGLLELLARDACAVVTDDFPAFFVPHMLEAAARQVSVRFEAVDSNGLYPLHATQRVFPTAASFRRHLQRELLPHLEHLPRARPLANLELPPPPKLPRDLLRRWPMVGGELLLGSDELGGLAIDHAVPPAPLRGGEREARRTMRHFLTDKLERYPDGRSHPDDDASSGLSPYLHFGHLSVHEIFHALATREGWSPGNAGKPTGRREGFWGMSAASEAFLDELITWRELGYNFSAHRDDADSFDSLPTWARATLDEHARDPRKVLYDFATLAAAETHDEVWNAAQRQLLREGRIHNYLRMLWGKKVLEWSESPREALSTLLELNNRWALDGRDPNSSSGILWCFGRYDRPWGPERPIFGTVRYMSSENTVRKLRMKRYLATWGG